MAIAGSEIPRVDVISKHRKDCKSRDRGIRFLRCDCPKQLYWYDGQNRYQGTGTGDYQLALRRAHEKEAELKAAVEGTLPPPKPEGKLVREAVEEYLQAKRDVGMSVDYISWLNRILTSLAEFCERNAVPELPDVKVSHLEKWRTSWSVGKSTARKWQGYTASFLAWSVKRDYVVRNEAEKLDSIKDGGTKQKRAITDAQLNIVLDALAAMPHMKPVVKAQLRALILLQRWTGLAIQDAVVLPRKSVKRDADGFYRVSLRRDKTGVDVYATVPPPIGDELMRVVNPTSPDYFFWDGKSEQRAAKTQPWIARYCSLAKQPGIVALQDEQGPLQFSSHIMRHSFAFYLLMQGMDITDVAKLMGHSNTRITEAHYSGWITARQQRLADRSKEAFYKWEADQHPATEVRQ